MPKESFNFYFYFLSVSMNENGENGDQAESRLRFIRILIKFTMLLS